MISIFKKYPSFRHSAQQDKLGLSQVLIFIIYQCVWIQFQAFILQLIIKIVVLSSDVIIDLDLGLS